MKWFLSLSIASCLAIATVSLTGCEHMNDPAPEYQGSFAGGTGAFGESPRSPGYYESDHVQPPAHSVAPSTISPQ
jgi:hypothetical protein